MKQILIIGVLVIFSSMISACSRSEMNNKKCSTWMLLENLRAETVSVTCSPPINIMDIYGLPRKKVESLLGAQHPDMPNSERVGYYKDGGIEVIYEKDAAVYIALLPENLPMNPASILGFLGLNDTLGQPLPHPNSGLEPENTPVTNLSWAKISVYPRISVNSAESKPEIVHSINVGMF